MTTTAVHLPAPALAERRVLTRGERRVLTLVGRLLAVVERRIALRAERRRVALDLLREAQTRRQDPRAVDHLLAQRGVSSH